MIFIALIAASSAWGYAAIVLDPTNLIQNTISALKAIESVINEVQMIANQVKQIENLVQNTRAYAGVWDREALPSLVRLGQIIEQEQAIAYTMTACSATNIPVIARSPTGRRPTINGRARLWTR
jgi:P-type conjugative transfer protein TrbJ